MNKEGIHTGTDHRHFDEKHFSGLLEEGVGVDLVVKFFLKERSFLLVEKCFILVGNCGSRAIKRRGHCGPAILSNGGGVWS